MVELLEYALGRGDAVTIETLRILDVDTPIEFLVGRNATREMDEAALLQGAREMAALINGVAWPPEYRAAFEGMRKIVFFAGQVEVNGFLLDRPGCDEDDATFYWEAEEFMRNTDADVRANTFFHDCWHVVQFKRSGNQFARGQEERVSREVDAINQQIEVARLLGCDAREIAFLEEFRDSQPRIEARLAEGVETRMRHAGEPLRA